MDSSLKTKVQKFGRFLSGMVMPNIGAFIAWGLITALFIPDGWLPSETFVQLVGPMIVYLLPLLIAYTGGKMVHGKRGAVIGATATLGVIIGSSVPMFIGAMIMGPFAAYIMKVVDNFLEDKVKTGFEMLVNNFSLGILGMLLAMLGLVGVGPLVDNGIIAVTKAVEVIVDAGFLPLVSIIVEPAKILFLNNALNYGVFSPIGVIESAEAGKSIFFLIETNPGPGLGILVAFLVWGKGNVKKSTPGSILIHFVGGIHEIYFPYVLMKPILVLAVIAGGMTGVFVFDLLGAGLVSTPAPGSILALWTMSPGFGDMVTVTIGVLASAAMSFFIASIFLRKEEFADEDLDNAQTQMVELKGKNNLTKIIFACDAGMGSSAMGASTLRKKFKDAGINIKVEHCSIDTIPTDTKLVVTQENLKNRAEVRVPNAEVVTIKNFIGAPEYDQLVDRLKK